MRALQQILPAFAFLWWIGNGITPDIPNDDWSDIPVLCQSNTLLSPPVPSTPSHTSRSLQEVKSVEMRGGVYVVHFEPQVGSTILSLSLPESRSPPR